MASEIKKLLPAEVHMERKDYTCNGSCSDEMTSATPGSNSILEHGQGVFLLSWARARLCNWM